MPEQVDFFDPIPAPQKETFGTEPRKLVRRNDPSTSINAACKVNTSALEKMVLDSIRSFGKNGCISDEVRDMFPHLPYSSVTARYKALIENKHIIDTGERRPGHSGRSQRVLRAVK